MIAQHKRQLEHQLAKDVGMPWSKAKHAVSALASSLDKWGYRGPIEVHKQCIVDLDEIDCGGVDW